MKKFLPVFILFLFFVLNLTFPSYAQTSTSSAILTPTPIPVTVPSSSGSVSEGTWIQDPEVTFVGKSGARSGEFLDWSLQNYSWSYVGSGEVNPLAQFWVTIRNIVYAFFLIVVLITAFIIIVTRGKNITITRFIPRFIFIVLFVTFSFALIQFFYQITDVIQSFFLKNPEGAGFISQKNLLNIGFDYKDFMGYRKYGAEFDESVFMSLLLVKLTAFTYYVMSGILLVRKIILWFFIIISPVFPLLLLYSPIRNTGKIWVGEFFRWLLYAPLFAVFLSGLVHVWRTSIPLPFDFNGAIVYPTAVNILLGGPGQVLSLENSINNKDTFAQYVVALLMLWVVIILPFILLHIFLDYFKSFAWGENKLVKQIMNTGSSLVGRNASLPPAPAPIAPPPSSHGAGLAKSLPFSSKIEIPKIETAGILSQINAIKPAQAQITNLTNLSIPTMRDIAKYESSALTHDISRHQEMAKVHETLERIANPTNISVDIDRQKFTNVKEKLSEEQQKGNVYATSVLAAAGVVSKGGKKEAVKTELPQANRVQQVSLDDYEAVKKMWKENYETLEPPKGFDGKQKGRKEWVESDIDKINETINLLSSQDPQNVQKGMEAVGNILPFLLLGGFSQNEVVTYLKAKLEAAKMVKDSLEKKTAEEETMVDRAETKTQITKTMEMKEEIPTTSDSENNVK